MFLVPFVVAFICLLLFFLYMNYSLSFKRALLVRKMRDYRVEWDRELSSNFEFYKGLGLEHRRSLLNKISVFINEKEWTTDADESLKLLVSARACLPIVNRKTNFYPLITEDFTSYSQEYWFSLNEVQFEKEVGKMPLREFNGEFTRKSIKYFMDPIDFKKENEREFKLLNYYYRLV